MFKLNTSTKILLIINFIVIFQLSKWSYTGSDSWVAFLSLLTGWIIALYILKKVFSMLIDKFFKNRTPESKSIMSFNLAIIVYLTVWVFSNI